MEMYSHLDSLAVLWRTQSISNKMEVCCLGNGKVPHLPSLLLLSNISPSLTLCQSPHNQTRTKDLGCISCIHGYVFAARIAGKVGSTSSRVSCIIELVSHAGNSMTNHEKKI